MNNLQFFQAELGLNGKSISEVSKVLRVYFNSTTLTDKRYLNNCNQHARQLVVAIYNANKNKSQ